MILYKYVTFDTAKIILQNSSLSFSHLEDFNDPFECTGLGLYDLSEPTMLLNLDRSAFKNRFSRNYVVLALTRNPLNALMWSHYCDSYSGVVIGIDTEKAGFADASKYLIPVQKGHITYINTLPKQIIQSDVELLMKVGIKEGLNWHQHESLLQHAFLYKKLDWAYEEEVRIVKHIKEANFPYHYCAEKRQCELDGDMWHRIQLERRPVYSVSIPQEAFVDVTIGFKTWHNLLRKKEAAHIRQNELVAHSHVVPDYENFKRLCQQLQLPLYRAEIDYDSWQLQRVAISDAEVK